MQARGWIPLIFAPPITTPVGVATGKGPQVVHDARRDLQCATKRPMLLRMSKKIKLPPHSEASIGATLRRWRKDKGWTRKQAAEHLGVNARTLESWEYGYRTPPSFKLLDNGGLLRDLLRSSR